MKTEIIVIRGALRGRPGWISGSLEDRARRGVTKAIVHAGAEVELLELANLAADRQLGLFPDLETKTPPARCRRRLMSRS